MVIFLYNLYILFGYLVIVIFLYNLYIFVRIQHSCLANMVFAKDPNSSVIVSAARDAQSVSLERSELYGTEYDQEKVTYNNIYFQQ